MAEINVLKNVKLEYKKNLRRIQVENYQLLIQWVKKAFNIQQVKLKYVDDENDVVGIYSEEEFQAAYACKQTSALRLRVESGESKDDAWQTFTRYHELMLEQAEQMSQKAQPYVETMQTLLQHLLAKVQGRQRLGRHEGVLCDECDGEIFGARFKCTVRHDFDLCSLCESRQVQPFPMVKIYTPQQAPSQIIVVLDGEEEKCSEHVQHGKSVFDLAARQFQRWTRRVFNQRRRRSERDSGRKEKESQVGFPMGQFHIIGHESQFLCVDEKDTVRVCNEDDLANKLWTYHDGMIKNVGTEKILCIDKRLMCVSMDSANDVQKYTRHWAFDENLGIIQNPATDSVISIDRTFDDARTIRFSVRITPLIKDDRRCGRRREKRHHIGPWMQWNLKSVTQYGFHGNHHRSFDHHHPPPFHHHHPPPFHHHHPPPFHHHHPPPFHHHHQNHGSEKRKKMCKFKGARNKVILQPRNETGVHQDSITVMKKPSAKFISNLTRDGMYLLSLEKGDDFMQVWEVENNGDEQWPEHTTVSCVGGDYISSTVRCGGVVSKPVQDIEVERALPGETVLIRVPMQVPRREGTIHSFWRLRVLNEGKEPIVFGPRLWVKMYVPPTTLQEPKSTALNLRDDIKNDDVDETKIKEKEQGKSKDDQIHEDEEKIKEEVNDQPTKEKNELQEGACNTQEDSSKDTQEGACNTQEDSSKDTQEESMNDVKEESSNDVKESQDGEEVSQEEELKTNMEEVQDEETQENASKKDTQEESMNDVQEESMNDVQEESMNDVKEESSNDVKEESSNDVKESQDGEEVSQEEELKEEELNTNMEEVQDEETQENASKKEVQDWNGETKEEEIELVEEEDEENVEEEEGEDEENVEDEDSQFKSIILEGNLNDAEEFVFVQKEE